MCELCLLLVARWAYVYGMTTGGACALNVSGNASSFVCALLVTAGAHEDREGRGETGGVTEARKLHMLA